MRDHINICQANIIYNLMSCWTKNKISFEKLIIDYEKIALQKYDREEFMRQKAIKASDDIRAYFEKIIKMRKQNGKETIEQ